MPVSCQNCQCACALNINIAIFFKKKYGNFELYQKSRKMQANFCTIRNKSMIIYNTHRLEIRLTLISSNIKYS